MDTKASLNNVCADNELESGSVAHANTGVEHQAIASDAASNGSAGVERPRITMRNWLNFVAYLVNVIVTYVSLTGIFGATNTELSNKYQTLVTPSGWAFSIWGPIFLWEAVFVIAQFLPAFRQSQVVLRVSPWWWSLCLVQCAWTLAFAQEQITVSLVFMLSILGSLLGISWKTNTLTMTVKEYFLLRAPFSLQLGWIIAASVVNINVQADAAEASQQWLLALAVLSNAAVLAIVALFTFAVKTPDPIVGFVAAWAFLGIYTELNNPTKLNDPARFNASTWDVVIIGGLRSAALCVSLISLVHATLATAFCVRRRAEQRKRVEN
jgi:hypothetical protein